MSDWLVDEGSLDKLIASHRSYEFLMDELWGKLQANVAEANLEVLKGYYSEFMFLAERWWHYAAIGEDKGSLAERELVSKLAKKHGMSKTEALEVVGILSHPEELAAFTRERRDFFELCMRKLENETDLVAAAQRYAREYFWKDTDFYERRVVDVNSVMADVEAAG